jgi:hypothetical protein
MVTGTPLNVTLDRKLLVLRNHLSGFIQSMAVSLSVKSVTSGHLISWHYFTVTPVNMISTI